MLHGSILVAAACMTVPAAADDELSELLKSAPATSAPAAVSAPNAPENKPTTDALGTLKPAPPAGARLGTVTLNNGTKLEGRVWTTLETPFRLWVEESKRYIDVDISLVQRMDVRVISETMEDDWRWLKEGSDEKVYSGKKYPNVELAYRFRLSNDQVVEGTVVAPIYFADGAKSRTLALYKKYKGETGESLKDLVYVTSVVLDPIPASRTVESRKLPLLPES